MPERPVFSAFWRASYRVRLDEVESNSGAVRARAEVPFNVPDTVVTGSVPQATASKRPDIAAAQQPQLAAAAATVLPDGGSPSAVVVPKIATTTVCLPRRQPLAHQPPHLRRGHALRRHLQGEPGADPRSQPDLSRPDLCPSDAVKRGHSSALLRRVVTQ